MRAAGSGHATTTNTIRQAGFAAGALVFILDVSKGFVPTWLALHYTSGEPRNWIVPITAALTVAGHCWPLFAGFRGGMGLACAGGCLLAIHLLAFLICAALLIASTLLIHHSARAAVLTGLLAAPFLWFFHLRDAVFWAALALGVVIAFRFLIDWNRQYRELWLDRQSSRKDSSKP